MGKLLRDLRGGNVAAVDLDAAAVEKTDIRAELLQNLEQRGHVGDLGNAVFARLTSTSRVLLPWALRYARVTLSAPRPKAGA